jgi:hypothetical protein
VTTWLIGEHNPYSRSADDALYPYPIRSAGWRLCHLVFAMDPTTEYLRLFTRRNLLTTAKWSKPLARAAAIEILAAATAGDSMALLGSKVAEAFGLIFEPFTVQTIGSYKALVLPHPSARCRLWNDPTNFTRARALVRGFVPGVHDRVVRGSL